MSARLDVGGDGGGEVVDPVAGHHFGEPSGSSRTVPRVRSPLARRTPGAIEGIIAVFLKAAISLGKQVLVRFLLQLLFVFVTRRLAGRVLFGHIRRFLSHAQLPL
jgi:hypothetical protein